MNSISIISGISASVIILAIGAERRIILNELNMTVVLTLRPAIRLCYILQNHVYFVNTKRFWSRL